MTRHGQILLQPTEFRAETDVPLWAHFPRLHLLLGWGPGIWETLGTRVAGLRHVFLQLSNEPERPPVASVMDWRDNFHQFSKLRDLAPPLVVEGVGAECVRFDFGRDGRVERQPHRCPSKRPHVIVPDGEYRVRHTFDGTGTRFTLELRTKSLKPELRAKREALGLRPDTARRASHVAERTFAEHVKKLRGPFVDRRTREMLKDPAKRPADFSERRAMLLRWRMGEIETRKRDASGKLRRPFPEDELLQRTCAGIAHLEARDLIFDFAVRDLCELSPAGFKSLT